MDGTIVTIYRDARLILLDKPAGLPAVPGRGPDKQDCLLSRLHRDLRQAAVVHRLDWATSGLILFALDADAQRDLSRQFAERRVVKHYTAVVRGEPRDEAGFIDLPLRKDFEHPPRHMVDAVHGKPAQTAWCVVERGGDRTRLELQPLTGRSHQLRLHLATIGHPILGDRLYADDAAMQMSPRLLLHAERLAFAHPDDGRPLMFTAPCPF